MADDLLDKNVEVIRADMIVRLVNLVLVDAIQRQATVILFCNQAVADFFLVKYQILGVFYNIMAPPAKILPLFINRLKEMANLDQNVTDKIQEGVFNLYLGKNQTKEVRFQVRFDPANSDELVRLTLEKV